MSQNEPYDEKVLLSQTAKGDEAAFRSLVYRYNRLLFSFIYDLTRSKEQTEEIVQDVFLQLWISREALEEINNFKAYLFIVARHKALNALRQAVRLRHRHEAWQKTADTSTDEEYSELIIDKESLLEEAIRQLPTQQRTVWLMSRREGLKYMEIANKLDLSRETVKRHLQRANHSITAYIKARISSLALLVYLSGELGKKIF